MIKLEFGNKQVTTGTYTRQELIDLVEGKIELTQFAKNPPIKMMNKSEGITEMVLNLDELDIPTTLKTENLSTLYLHTM